MTRPWGTHTQSALGAKKHTGALARGPSDTTFTASGTTAAPVALALNGIDHINGQTLGTEDFTTYTCFTDISPPACSAPAASETKTRTAIRYWANEWPYRETYSTVTDYEVDGDDLGIYAHDGNTGAYRCYEYFRVTSDTDYGTGVIVPRDTNDRILYVGCRLKAAAEADRKTSIGACGAGWSPSDPTGITYREVAQSVGWCYHVLSRADADTAWSTLILAGDFPSGASTYSYLWKINQTNGTIWCKDSANTCKVWPVGTLYSASTPTTITLPAGNVSAVGMWDKWTLVTSTTGDVYLYDGTTASGTIPSPLNPATWTYMAYAFGWVFVREPGYVHIFRLDDDGIEWRQTLAGNYFCPYPVGDDTAAGQMTVPEETYPWRRFLFDHSTQEWADAGGIPTCDEAIADGWSFYDAEHRHIVFRKQDGATYDYKMVQVF